MLKHDAKASRQFLAFVNMPIFLAWFMALRDIADHHSGYAVRWSMTCWVTALQMLGKDVCVDEAFLWLPSLIQHDPYYSLPVLSSAPMILTMRVRCAAKCALLNCLDWTVWHD